MYFARAIRLSPLVIQGLSLKISLAEIDLPSKSYKVGLVLPQKK